MPSSLRARSRLYARHAALDLFLLIPTFRDVWHLTNDNKLTTLQFRVVVYRSLQPVVRSSPLCVLLYSF